jgi:hypothetical protein
MEKLAKEHLSLAGEYAVASELCKRGIYAQLTLGTRKKTDLLVDTETGMLRIQVKAKQVDRWTCRGVFGKDIVLVLVDYENKKLDQRPDFYILTPSDWGEFVKWWLSDDISEGKVVIDKENCPIWSGRKEGGRPFKGTSVFPVDVAQHKECWEKIEDLLSEKR